MPLTELEQAWLVPDIAVERVELDATSWVDVARGLVVGADALHDELAATVPWQVSKVWRYEKYIEEPRLASWQAGADRHPALIAVQTWITRRYRVSFDGVSLVQYRNERDSVGWHRDRELRWLDDTVIGVLTLGAHRPWMVRPLTGRRESYEDDDLANVVDLSPRSGDLLVMGGRTQADWLHAVPKVRGRVTSRVSGQWRWTSKRGRRDTNPGFYAPRNFSR
jgi:alkylated DNA repair dioxygenase AlkB